MHTFTVYVRCYTGGMHGWQQACKLEDTPFPFPYAQVVSFVLAVFALSYPLVALTASGAYGAAPSNFDDTHGAGALGNNATGGGATRRRVPLSKRFGTFLGCRPR